MFYWNTDLLDDMASKEVGLIFLEYQLFKEFARNSHNVHAEKTDIELQYMKQT
jgi:hypothetical protein